MQSRQANRGRTLEDLMETAFDAAGPSVWVRRQNNLWVPLRGKQAFPKKGSPVDFVGVIDGTAVAIECKESAGPRLSLGKQRFPHKEIEALQQCEIAGGQAFVVAAFWLENTLAVYRFSDFHKRWEAYQRGSRAHVTVQDATFSVSIGDALLIPHLLLCRG